MLEIFYYMIIFGYSNDSDLYKLMTEFFGKCCNLVIFSFIEREIEFVSFMNHDYKCMCCMHTCNVVDN